ncbi:flagellar basal body P-ring formation protein FlgA [Methylobacterium sp. WL18]|uniref:flagellar basal body P-ring formation chaperone FlgA n=1 Tax=Methylobacterium sp. WL18 TaxID=2603897 RepID=UPI0011C8E652|nr:flagellar basal body P-ring formation chaperone FlgA [Methylobacterium sp. WL18]TXN64531.1 flagellar basal body P-ring formation protein FlgA [Methylobacterium sp. WL18]
MYAGSQIDLADLPLVSTATDESDLSPIVRRARPRVALPGAAVLMRAALAFLTFAAIGALAIPAMAQTVPPQSESQKAQPRLRGDVTARGDVLALSDLVEGAPAALKRALETGYGLDPHSVAVRFDGDGPTLLAPVDLAGQATALDLTYDPRSRRVTGLVSLGERQASLRVSGVVVELREVAVLTRSLNRGDPVRDGDLVVERRPREMVAADAQAGAATVLGEVAQHALPAGTVLRVSDTALPELVARGESVTIVYETASVSLSMRGLANEAGRMGAVVNVVNVASKKVLQATVIGPGRVSVGPVPTAQQAAAAPQVQATASLR